MGLTAGESFLKSILDMFRSTTANGSKTVSISLSTATPLAAFKCKAVYLLSNCSFVTGGGDTIAITSPVLLPCNDASEIIVSGSGTLNYLILF